MREKACGRLVSAPTTVPAALFSATELLERAMSVGVSLTFVGTTPELNGAVVHVSADLISEQRSGLNYFLVRIGLSKEEIERLRGVKLTPGMPVESFIRTQSRTILSYLTKPLRDQAMRAMRER